ncbi:MAG: hypothetical protein HY042_09780 [Spirochaetia bacterium]|nr:hypothetical protein [Spirochaetia bacterium]
MLVPQFLKLERNLDLKAYGIDMNYVYVADGMYRSPFIIPFTKYLFDMSSAEVDIEAVNTYTVGSYDPAPGCGFKGEYSNMLNPKCKLANAWWGVYFVFDDVDGRGARFFLKDVKADHGNPENFNYESVKMVPMLDQKLIVWSTHEGQAGYSWQDFLKEFQFSDAGTPVEEEVKDGSGRAWKRYTGVFKTIAALTDTRKTNMGITSSIRAYVGLPTDRIYAHVDPWYPFTLKGAVNVRYFSCGSHKYWALVYYNASVLSMKDGKSVDYWVESDVRAEFEKMFQSLHLECAR